MGCAVLSVKKGSVSNFSLKSDEGKGVSFKDLMYTKGVVLYFYPKDDSPVCSMEALEFSAKFAEFKAAGFNILGISPDSFRSHRIFKARYNIPFTLLSDTERTVISDYGLWVKKKMFGREYMGVQRATFLIASDMVIIKSWIVSSVKGHADVVLKEIKAREY